MHVGHGNPHDNLKGPWQETIKLLCLRSLLTSTGRALEELTYPYVYSPEAFLTPQLQLDSADLHGAAEGPGHLRKLHRRTAGTWRCCKGLQFLHSVEPSTMLLYVLRLPLLPSSIYRARPSLQGCSALLCKSCGTTCLAASSLSTSKRSAASQPTASGASTKNVLEVTGCHGVLAVVLALGAQRRCL